MTLQEKINILLGSRLKNRKAMQRASRSIDQIREKFGKPERDFNSVDLLRKLRDSR